MSFVVELLNTTALYGCPAPPSQSSLKASSMAPRRTVTGKEAMASRHVAFFAAHDRTHGKEAMASRRAEFIAVGVNIVTWADFEAAMAEWAVDLDASKVVQKKRKRNKAAKKEIPASARKKRPHVVLRRAWRGSKHGGLPPTRPGRRTPASGLHALMAACEK